MNGIYRTNLPRPKPFFFRNIIPWNVKIHKFQSSFPMKQTVRFRKRNYIIFQSHFFNGST